MWIGHTLCPPCTAFGGRTRRGGQAWRILCPRISVSAVSRSRSDLSGKKRAQSGVGLSAITDSSTKPPPVPITILASIVHHRGRRPPRNCTSRGFSRARTPTIQSKPRIVPGIESIEFRMEFLAVGIRRFPNRGSRQIFEQTTDLLKRDGFQVHSAKSGRGGLVRHCREPAGVTE